MKLKELNFFSASIGKDRDFEIKRNFNLQTKMVNFFFLNY